MPFAKITICMGSSCFSRGNQENLQLIQEFLADNELTEKVELVGELCQGECSQGPNLHIGDQAYHEVDPATLWDLLRKEYLKED